jgi:DNA-binding GntR family transcriptional regulator
MSQVTASGGVPEPWEGAAVGLNAVPRTLAARAVQELRQRILDGRIAAGEKISAAVVAKELGVSPVPVREALQALQGEGLVTVVGHRGAVAATASRQELSELYALRELLEPAAVRAAEPALLEQRAGGLVTALEDVAAALEQGDRDRFRVAHRDFHLGLCACAGSSWMLRLVASLYDHCERYRSVATWQRDPHEAAEEHRALLKAMRDGRADDAGRLAAAHLEVTRHLALATLSDPPQTTPRR